MGQEEMGWCRICEAVSRSQGETPATLPRASIPRRDWLGADDTAPGISVKITRSGFANAATRPPDKDDVINKFLNRRWRVHPFGKRANARSDH